MEYYLGLGLGSGSGFSGEEGSGTRAAAAALKLIESLTLNCDEVQEKVLCEILQRNGGVTEYLKRYGVEGITDRAGFKSRAPVITYEDILPEIRRIANGDIKSPILSSEPISEFLTSSGTSAGERKLMPTIREEMDRRQLLYSLLMPVMNQYVPGLDKGKALYFLFIKSESKTPGGLVARPVLTSYYKSDQFKNRAFDPYNVYTSPNDAILCPDSFQSMYAQMLCGLYQRLDVLRVGAVFASGLLRAIRFLLQHYRDLCRDISLGTTASWVFTDPALRSTMAQIMRPDPNLARIVTEECNGNGEGIIKRIWPNTKYLEVIVTGAMAQYIPILDYYSGGLPKACTMYASSECYFGLNLRPMCDPSEVSYTIMPNMAYFEFIPIPIPNSTQEQRPKEEEEEEIILVDLANVEVGKLYELVVTTYAGLYRYRVGDVLLVTGFHNSAPQFRFIRRKNVLLSIDSDKTDEAELQKAVDRAASLLRGDNKLEVLEYTSYAHTTNNMNKNNTVVAAGHYVVYWELNNNDLMIDEEVLSSCCLEMEESFGSVYRQCRVADGSIGPLEIRLVKCGTFEELMDYAISKGASINQYKVPRCVTSKTPLLELLDARVISSHFSPSLPTWKT